MGFEIEHKYLVINDSYRAMAKKCYHIVQAYLCRDVERTIRIRKRNDQAFLTIKGKTDVDKRLEYEYEISVEDFNGLLNLAKGRIIEKQRYIVDYAGNEWEVDEFGGDLKGLVIAEIELSNSDYNYACPDFVGEDVTTNPAYYNSNL